MTVPRRDARSRTRVARALTVAVLLGPPVAGAVALPVAAPGAPAVAAAVAPPAAPPVAAAVAPPVAASDDPAAGGLPEVVLTGDDLRVDRSCRLVIPDGLVVVDDEGDGAVAVVADGVRLEFAPGSVLRGAAPGARPDTFTGTGIRIDGARDVAIVGARVRGFHVGLHATGADGLLVEDADVSDNRHQHLRSTPEAADDAADWLRPHDNDEQQWRADYGAGLCIESSRGVTVRRCLARRVQNGLILDRVDASAVYDNDFSFLSGWGLALWRSSDNVISRNALDFCVRGYSHGVYNRGQDSAGLLLFEQCHRNLIAENSMTHGGDGLFAFAGREALGETDATLDLTRRGHTGNLIVGNDCSWAAAHGLELTFSFGNAVIGNLFRGNAICGIWGGYSKETLIRGNRFIENGDAGYGLERGGINIEHGERNLVEGNRFERNAVGVHLWWDEDPHLVGTRWARVNGSACADNALLGNVFEGDGIAVQLRGAERTLLAGNDLREVGTAIEAVRSPVLRQGTPPDLAAVPSGPELEVLGETRPVGARIWMWGREWIVMTPWGPWDHDSPLLQRTVSTPDRHTYRLALLPPDARVDVRGPGVSHTLRLRRDRLEVSLPAGARGVFPYRIEITADGDPDALREPLVAEGVLQRLGWEVTAFPWETDPREDVDAWRAEAAAAASAERAVTITTDALDLRYAMGGPAELPLFAEELTPPVAEALGTERFGTLARTTIPLAPGTWQVTTLSDDGVRVLVDGTPVLEDWTWHGPTTDVATFTVGEVDDAGRPVDEDARPVDVSLEVEHFELDGYATLSVELRRHPLAPPRPNR